MEILTLNAMQCERQMVIQEDTGDPGRIVPISSYLLTLDDALGLHHGRLGSGLAPCFWFIVIGICDRCENRSFSRTSRR
jgi:hypothetical protein